MNADTLSRVHFLHIRKTGGTAVKHALSTCLRTENYTIELHPHTTTLRDVPQGEKVMFFIRDPVSRFVSGFYSKQRRGQPRYDNPWTPEEKVAFEQFSTSNELAMALSSKDKALQTAAVNAMKDIRHVNSSYWDWFENEAYFLSRLSDVFFIGSLEKLDDDFALLRDKLNLPNTITLPKDDVETNRNPQGLDKRLEEKARKNIEAWYASDNAFVELCQALAKPINART